MDDGQLHAYLDGELGDSGDDAAALEVHFAECPACVARLEAIRSLREEGRAFLAGGGPLSVEQPPFEEVIARSRRPAAVPRRAPRYLVRGAWAASLVAALGVGWLARGILREEGPERLAVVEQPERPSAGTPASSEEATRVAAPGSAAGEAAATPPAAPRGLAARVPETGGAARSDSAPSDTPRSPDEPVVVALEEVAATGYSTARRRDVASAAAPPAPPPPVAAAPSGRMGAPIWTAIDRAEATRLLRRAPLTLPAAPVLAMERGEVDGRPTVRVRQAIEGGGVLTLLQQPSPEARLQRGSAAADLRAESAPPPSANAETEVSTLRGTVLVTARAALPADSLRALLERLR